MDRKKLIVLTIVVVLLVSSVILYVNRGSDDTDKGYDLLAKVNMGGAGIYLDADYDPSDFIEINVDGDITYNVDAWRGRIFGTPGTENILHIQLEEIITGQLGLGFVEYVIGEPVSQDFVYYQPDIISAESFENESNAHLDGGIIWEPQFQFLIGSKTRQCVPLMSTADFDNALPCCVIAGSHRYLQSHENETLRFLKAYVKSVEWVKAAIGDKNSHDYRTLVDMTKEITGVEDEQIVKESMERVIYTYGMTSVKDSKDAPLRSLKDEVQTVMGLLVKSGNLSQTLVDDMGFEDPGEFAQRFVNDKYLVQAMNNEVESTGNCTIRVFCITECIHQMALHAGIALGFFDELDVDLEITFVTNGTFVAAALQNGEADIGFMGLPPATATTVNNGLITK